MKRFLLLISIISSISTAEIIRQSDKISICEEEEFSIFVNASGTVTNYTWYKDGIVLNNEKQAGIYIERASHENSGIYFCDVTFDNGINLNTERSEVIPVSVNTKTEIVEIFRSIRIEGDEQVWTLHADVHEAGVNDYSFRWEFEQSINRIEDMEGITGITTNRLVVRFPYAETKLDYVRPYRLIVEGDCGIDSAIVEIEDFNIELTLNSNDKTICEAEAVTFPYQVDYFIPKDFLFESINLDFYKNDLAIDRQSIMLDPDKTRISGTFTDLGPTYGDYKIKSYIQEIGFELESDEVSVSYYPLVRVTDRSTEPFVIDAGQPLKLRVWAEGSIRNYIWIKGESDTLSAADEPFYEKLVSNVNDAGDYRCFIDGTCNDTTLFFTVIVNSGQIEDDFTLSISELERKVDFENAVIFNSMGQIVSRHALRGGLYFLRTEENIYKIYLRH